MSAPSISVSRKISARAISASERAGSVPSEADTHARQLTNLMTRANLRAEAARFACAVAQVRRSHYETFWYTHHFFVLFFVLLLFHSQ
eukprot:6205883-Pleurochrysis_carterae.AAC.2